MDGITVTELELLSFFGVEPVCLDAGIPWPYNRFSYRLQCGDVSVSFAITPSYKDLALTVKTEDAVFYQLDAAAVDDVRYLNDKGRELLEIALSATDKLWLRLHPQVSVFQVAKQMD